MSKNWKNRPARNWKEIEYRLRRPHTVGSMVTFGLIWALTGFNSWVGFGFIMAILGMVGFFGSKFEDIEKDIWGESSKEKNDDYYDDDDDDDDEYYKRKEDKYRQEPKKSETTQPVVNEASKSPAPLHSQIIQDASGDIEHLRAASNTASDNLGLHLRNMVASVEKVQKGLEEDPNRLSQVQRLFTYYLPSTTDLLKARGKAAAIGDTKKLGEIDAMIDRLEDAFDDFAARINGEDARSVEIDIKLLDQSLAQEFSHIEKDRV